MRSTRLISLILLVGLSTDMASGDEVRFRQPVALASSPDGSRLFVANRRSGSLSIVDLNTGRVTLEFDVGKGLADLASLPDGRLLAVDREGDALLVLKVGEGSVEVETRFSVADPASVLASPDGSSCVVASTASHQLSVISLVVEETKKVAPKVDRVIALPFAPRLLAWAKPGTLLVAADAFGGRIAVNRPDPRSPRLGPVDPRPQHPRFSAAGPPTAARWSLPTRP